MAIQNLKPQGTQIKQQAPTQAAGQTQHEGQSKKGPKNEASMIKRQKEINRRNAEGQMMQARLAQQQNQQRSPSGISGAIGGAAKKKGKKWAYAAIFGIPTGSGVLWGLFSL